MATLNVPYRDEVIAIQVDDDLVERACTVRIYPRPVYRTRQKDFIYEFQFRPKNIGRHTMMSFPRYLLGIEDEGLRVAFKGPDRCDLRRSNLRVVPSYGRMRAARGTCGIIKRTYKRCFRWTTMAHIGDHQFEARNDCFGKIAKLRRTLNVHQAAGTLTEAVWRELVPLRTSPLAKGPIQRTPPTRMTLEIWHVYLPDRQRKFGYAFFRYRSFCSAVERCRIGLHGQVKRRYTAPGFARAIGRTDPWGRLITASKGD